jgi:hypothetical protein
MITTLISILIAALVFYLIYYVARMFIQGRPLKIVGLILGLMFILYALRTAHLVAI